MLTSKKTTLFLLGILLITLLVHAAWGDSKLPEQMSAQAFMTLPENQGSAQTGLGARADSAVIKAADNEPDPGESGDGRGGFWIVGILINLSVLGWFLAWAVKEWRKKRDD